MRRQYRAAAALPILVAAVTLVLADGTLEADAKSSSEVAATRPCPAVAASTLSFACGDACSANQGCIAPAMANSSAVCRCLKSSADSPTGYTNFTLLLPFDDATNSSLNSAKLPESDVSFGTWDLDAYSWVSTSEVTKIEPLSLPPTATTVTIRGGDSLNAISKGFFAKVSIDPKFIADASQVTSVTINNINLASSINTVALNLPSALTTLNLANTELMTFPSAITKMTAVKTLSLSFNNIEELTAEHTMPELTELNLYRNKLKSFMTLYPKLETLNLGGNKLAAVPSVVTKYTQLKTLQLGNNSFTTFGQSNAVASLTKLYLDYNHLKSFEANVLNLEYLNLVENDLTESPLVIFSFAKLSELYVNTHARLPASTSTLVSNQPGLTCTHTRFGMYIKQNALMQNVSFTNEQANFLNYVTTFAIDKESLQADCPTNQKYKLKAGMTVCIQTVIDVATIEGSHIVAPPPTSSTSSSSDDTPASDAASTKSTPSPAPIIGGSIAAVLVVALVLVLVWHRRRKTTGKRNSTTHLGTYYSIEDANAHDVSVWRDDELLRLKVSIDDIKDVRKLGSGAFADVWLVQFRTVEFMASKRLRDNDATPKQVQAFTDEIKLVATLKHPSIVALKGVAWVRESDLQALFEYMDSGDLRAYLLDTNIPKQWSVEKLQIAIDIVEALVYVHSFSLPLVHRDLKSHNVLLSRCGEDDSTSDTTSGVLHAKLTDFGISRYRSVQNTMTAGVGTGRWLAPEVIAGAGDYGSPVDMFSFGVVLFELDTHEIPYANACSTNGNKLPDVAILQRVASGQLTPSMSATCPPKISELANACFAHDPAARPAAPEVAYALRTLQKSFVEVEYVV